MSRNCIGYSPTAADITEGWPHAIVEEVRGLVREAFYGARLPCIPERNASAGILVRKGSAVRSETRRYEAIINDIADRKLS